jgi:hypothetical protein
LGYPPGKPELVYAGELIPTQKEIVASKVWELVKKLQKNPYWQREIVQQCYGQKVDSATQELTRPVPVSADLRLLDAHHRAVAILAAGEPSGSGLICVRRIPMKMEQLLEIAVDFARAIGIQSEKGVH